MPSASLSGIEFTIKGNADSASNSVKKLTENLNRLKSVLAGDIAKFAKFGGKSLGKLISYPLRQATTNAAGLAKGLSGVLSGFKRIVGYRIIRSVIKEITQGFSEGVKNLYGWSRELGGAMIDGKTFADTMNGIATSMLYLKNSVGAAAAPFISALAPAIDYVIDKAVALLNVINQLMALFSGATSWNRAIKKTQEYGDAVGGAGAAAKEALKYLAPFDELNVLPSDRNGGGGGGGGSDYSDMFEEVSEFNEAIANFADMIKEKVNAGDWQGLGTLLGNKINDIIDMIDFAGLGTKVGAAINSLFTTKYWTFQTINFTNIGTQIATFLNNALSEIDFDTVGRSLTQWFTNLGDLILGAVGEIDWRLVGQSIGNLVRGAFNQVSEWMSGIDWGEVGRNIPVWIGNAIDGLDVGSLATSIWNLLKGAVDAAIGLLSGLGQWLFGGGSLEIKLSLANAVQSIGSWIKSEIIDPIVGAFDDFVANHPTIAKLLGFPGASGGGTTINAGEFSGITGTLSIDAEANLTTVKDNVPLGQKIIDKVKGIFGSTDDSKVNNTEVNTIAKMNSVKPAFMGADATSDGKFPIISAVLRANQIRPDFRGADATSDGKFPILSSIARFTSRNDALTDDQKKFSTRANFMYRTDSLTDAQKQFNTKSNFLYRSDSLTDGQKTFNSSARFTDGWWNDPYNPPVLEAKAKFTSGYKDPAFHPTIDVTAHIVGSGGNVAMETGGAFYGNRWHKIPQAASGGNFHGTLFWAGENGAEVVGHAGGRTEVLNRSQLAATMYSAVHSAMNGIAFNVSAPSMATGTADDGMNEDMLYRAFLRALNDSDVGDRPIEIDGSVVYNKMVQRNRMERARTGINPMLSY